MITLAYRYLVVCILQTAILSGSSAQTLETYDDVIKQGNNELQAGHTEAALTAGESAIKSNNARWEGYALAGGALMNLRRYEDAADRLSEAVQRAPEAKRPVLRDLRRESLVAETGVPTVAASAPAATTSQAEIVLWKTIESSTNGFDFQTYLEQYPHGAFVALAQRHLADVQAQHEREAQRIADKAAADNRAIRSIAFRRGSDGAGRVTVQLTDPRTSVNVRQEGNQILVDFAATTTPKNLLRRYDVTDFATPVQTVEAIRASGVSRLVITARGPFEQSGNQSDTEYTIAIKSTTAPAATGGKDAPSHAPR